MKNIILLLSFLILITSCENEPVDFQPIYKSDYEVALDKLVNYDNYFIGEFNGELLVSTEFSSRAGGGGNVSQDSVPIQFSYQYRISNSEYLQTPSVSFLVYESLNKLDSINYYRYNEYNDFYNFFNNNELEYFEVDNYKNVSTQVLIRHIDYSQLINNTGVNYVSSDFDKPPFNENNFQIESIREIIEGPFKDIELTYSFNCILLSDSNQLIEIKNGKGKCTFRY